MRLYIIRHGDPNYKDDCLTERGEQEAAALAAYIPRLHLTHLYVSPMGRAKATCAPTERALGMTAETLDWARELTGLYYNVEGYGVFSPFNLAGELMYDITPEPKYKDWNKQPYFDDPRVLPRLKEMTDGSDALLARHGYVREGSVYRVEKPSYDRVAVFCHQGIGTTWIAHLLHLPYQAAWAGLWQGCTSITTISMECRSEAFAVPRMLGMSETPHIDVAGLPRVERGLLNLID